MPISLRRPSFVLCIVVMTSTSVMGQQCPPGQSPMVYPVSKKVTQVDDYHGVKVSDP